MGKIGFRSYDKDEKSPSSEQSSQIENKQEPISDKDIFRQFILDKYNTIGDESAKVFKTSRDLAYDTRDMCSPSLPDIAAVMKELGFTYDGFMLYYAWVLYEKEPLRY